MELLALCKKIQAKRLSHRKCGSKYREIKQNVGDTLPAAQYLLERDVEIIYLFPVWLKGYWPESLTLLRV